MEEPVCSLVTAARPIIEQCRRNIAATWEKIEEAKEILERTKWLMSRWVSENPGRGTSAQPDMQALQPGGRRKRRRHRSVSRMRRRRSANKALMDSPESYQA